MSEEGVIVYVYVPAGWDLLDPWPHHPIAGTRVHKVQPAGRPVNVTLEHCFIEDAESDAFYGLVATASLQQVKEER